MPRRFHGLWDPAFIAGPREVFDETDQAWILRLDLPGERKSDVTVTVTDQVMQLVAETPSEQPFGGKYKRQWNFGDDIDSAALSARLEESVASAPGNAEPLYGPRDSSRPRNSKATPSPLPPGKQNQADSAIPRNLPK